ncbi:peptidyl-prolyl cis-trans isomerase cyclophilin type [Kribbella flavida DSM 17836]|uniref:Peptidyl-prolyl cis-trans isomerase cyclophilin type n=1 Tax=Kribbella flavida (strain DSM 17836 / JCM 10339 / NBRC 14399) TaxID=479435 RepID=D2PM45_KRIFD|nr:peptidylprolyl isomerase [Kribbella flavida]ADB34413.1 peptidyl-prolyl cis-trans isomerase cyclophilin type [Kribbella flavida DSM 17836]
MKRSFVPALIATTLLAATLTTTTASAAPAPSGGGAPTVRCEFTPTPENPAAKPVTVPSATAKARGTVDVFFATNYGPFVVRMDRANAPCGVHNFVHLTKSRFYDRTQCFRLTNSARLGVLQCGDIYRQEEGGPGYKFPDEVTGRETYPRGTVAYGNQGPGTNGSEFFVVHSFANIPPNYTVLGRVIFGMSTFDRIVAAGIADPDLDGPPTSPVRILKVLTLG